MGWSAELEEKEELGLRTENAVNFLQTILATSDEITAILDANKRPLLFGRGGPSNQATLLNAEMIPVSDDGGSLVGFVLRKKEKNCSDSDYLTGAMSRRRLEKEFAVRNNSRSTDSDLVLLFIDLDRFKPVNELFGHLVGDQVLLQFAALLKNSFRASDCVARYGGDEFVILCSCPFEVAVKRVQEFQARLAKQYIEVSFPKSETEKERITLSFCYGITPVFSDDSFDTALKRADLKLLEMKRNERGIK